MAAGSSPGRSASDPSLPNNGLGKAVNDSMSVWSSACLVGGPDEVPGFGLAQR